VAERNRRGAGAADEYGDEPFDDGTGRERDELSGGGTATKSRTGGRSMRFGRVGRFIREVVAELGKVIWPTRKELVTYAVVVIVFISILMAIIGLYDYVFGRLVQLVFGN
jgi:preprotein translocase subunit SecE